MFTQLDTGTLAKRSVAGGKTSVSSNDGARTRQVGWAIGDLRRQCFGSDAGFSRWEILGHLTRASDKDRRRRRNMEKEVSACHWQYGAICDRVRMV